MLVIDFYFINKKLALKIWLIEAGYFDQSDQIIML